MSEAHAIEPEPVMTELLSWPQICECYPDQWVALVEMDWNEETDEFTTARVAGHGATRAEPYAQMRRAGLRYEQVGHFYTGRVRAHALDFAR